MAGVAGSGSGRAGVASGAGAGGGAATTAGSCAISTGGGLSPESAAPNSLCRGASFLVDDGEGFSGSVTGAATAAGTLGGAGMDALLAAAFLLFSIELVASFLSPPEREPSFLRLRSPSARAPPSFA